MMLTATLVFSTEAILAVAGMLGTTELAAMTAIRGLTYFTQSIAEGLTLTLRSSVKEQVT